MYDLTIFGGTEGIFSGRRCTASQTLFYIVVSEESQFYYFVQCEVSVGQ